MTLTGNRTITVTTVGANLTIGGVIGATGPYTLTAGGAGTLTLTGSNLLTGGVTLSGGGQLNINNPLALGTGTFTISSNSNDTIDNTSGTR